MFLWVNVYSMTPSFDEIFAMSSGQAMKKLWTEFMDEKLIRGYSAESVHGSPERGIVPEDNLTRREDYLFRTFVNSGSWTALACLIQANPFYTRRYSQPGFRDYEDLLKCVVEDKSDHALQFLRFYLKLCKKFQRLEENYMSCDSYNGETAAHIAAQINLPALKVLREFSPFDVNSFFETLSDSGITVFRSTFSNKETFAYALSEIEHLPRLLIPARIRPEESVLSCLDQLYDSHTPDEIFDLFLDKFSEKPSLLEQFQKYVDFVLRTFKTLPSERTPEDICISLLDREFFSTAEVVEENYTEKSPALVNVVLSVVSAETDKIWRRKGYPDWNIPMSD